MTRQRLFLDVSCVDAARERVRHIYDTHDTVAVQVSGGKDSLAVLHLAREIHENRGLGPVRAIFRDEEMVSPSVVRKLEQIRSYDWVDLEWYCLPMGQEIYVLGRREYVLLWSKERERQGRLVRDFPSWAIRAEHFGLDPEVPVPESIDLYTMQGKTGSVCFLQGVRANESMLRYRSITQKLHEPYIVKPFRMKKSVPLQFGKPIYDWTTNDVLAYVCMENAEPLAEYYNLAALVGANTRVGIPLHSVAARRLNDVVTTEPEFFDRLVAAFPQIDAQARYWSEFNVETLIADYASQGWDGVADCLDDNFLTPGIRKNAEAFVADYRRRHVKDPFSFPVEWLVRVLMLNEIGTTSPSPVGPKTRAHTMRVKAMEDADADSLDAVDDFR